MAAKYTAEHPVMREINGQLAAINKQIGELNSTFKATPRCTAPILTVIS